MCSTNDYFLLQNINILGCFLLEDFGIQSFLLDYLGFLVTVLDLFSSFDETVHACIELLELGFGQVENRVRGGGCRVGGCDGIDAEIDGRKRGET